MRNTEQLGMIKELVLTLLDEVESLAGTQGPAPKPCENEGEADFYEMINAYEKFLIRRALLKTRGHQARAARMLRLKPTTLNYKIKLYNISTDPKEVDCAGGVIAAGRAEPRAQSQEAP